MVTLVFRGLFFVAFVLLLFVGAALSFLLGLSLFAVCGFILRRDLCGFGILLSHDVVEMTLQRGLRNLSFEELQILRVLRTE